MRVENKRHYEANKKDYLARKLKRQKEIGALIKAYKQEHPTCSDCEQDHPYWRLDFDHLSKATKTAELSNVAKRGWSNARVLEEIAKCQLVCANCHRDRTQARLRR